MIRPLIQAIYDYRMAFNQQTNTTIRNNYKIHYVEASTILAVQNVFEKMNNKQLSMEEAINQWNNQPKDQISSQTRDYKTRLDEIFISKNKNYFHREHERSLSKDKTQEFRQTQKINQTSYNYRPKDNSNTFHKYSEHQYKQSGGHHYSQKDGYNPPHKEGNGAHYRQGGYGQRYRNQRY